MMKKNGKKSFLFVLTLVAVLISLLPLYGCNQKNGTAGRIEHALRLMPDFGLNNEQGNYVTIIDYAAIRDKFKVSLPASKTEYENYFDALGRDSMLAGAIRGGFISGINEYTMSIDYKKNLGFDLTNLDIDVQYQAIPPATHEILIGSYEPESTATAFSKQDGWSQTAKDDFKTEDYRSVTIYSWGPGRAQHLENPLQPPIYDALGRAMPLAVTDGQVYYSDSVDNVKKMIDAGSDNTSGIDSISAYKQIAKGLDSMGAFCVIVASSSAMEESEYTTIIPDTGNAPLLKEYTAFGTGVGKDDKGYYMALVITHDNDTAALENSKILQQRIDNVSWEIGGSINTKRTWKENVTDSQINVNGETVVAKIYTKNPAFGFDWFNTVRVPLLLHESQTGATPKSNPNSSVAIPENLAVGTQIINAPNGITIPNSSVSIGEVQGQPNQQKISYTLQLQNNDSYPIYIEKITPNLADSITSRLVDDNISVTIDQTISPNSMVEIKGSVIFDSSNLTKEDIVNMMPLINGFKVV